MKKITALFLASVLAVSMLSGCSGSQSSTQATTAQATVAETAAQTETATPAETTEIETEAAANAGDMGELKPLAMPWSVGGGLIPLEEEKPVDELTEEEQADMDRAMRAYTPSGDSLLINNAETFYYYSQMTKDQQTLYDAMLMVADDPVDPNNIVVATLSVDPSSAAFADVFLTAYFGLLYDHAELFWLYNTIEDDILVYLPAAQPSTSSYQVYLCLDKVYENYEKQMNAFNDAVEDFLSDIDLDKEDPEIVQQIHDKLIDMVAYNTPVMEDNTKAGGQNFAHTAYGALVEDSKGNPHYAVCDGYSQAFVYLLQQVGINAAVIVGVAGDSMLNSGGHAWSVVELDGDWYEIDSTWDDAGTLDEQVEEFKGVDELSYKYYTEALEDPDYREILDHYLFNVTTDTITDYKMPEDAYYITKDQKYKLSLIFDSIHVRASKSTLGFESYISLMELAPNATGTKYAFK